MPRAGNPCRLLWSGGLRRGGFGGRRASAATSELRFDQQKLTGKVDAAPLAEVLRAVAEETGIEIEVRGDLGDVRPQAFEGVPLEEAIRRLVGNNRVNLIMRYEVDAAGERRAVAVVARAAGEVPPALLEERLMRAELARIRVPPPPPPPPIQ